MKSINWKNPVALILAALLALPGGALWASVTDYTTSPRQPHGQVIGDIGQPTRDIYPVRVVRVNGHNVPGAGRSVLWLKPGDYQLHLSAEARMLRNVPGNLRPRRDERMGALELTVEEGKTYRIGALHLHRDRESRGRAFKPVVWKVTDAEGNTRYPVREGDFGSRAQEAVDEQAED